jgi:hypothetical protein
MPNQHAECARKAQNFDSRELVALFQSWRSTPRSTM